MMGDDRRRARLFRGGWMLLAALAAALIAACGPTLPVQSNESEAARSERQRRPVDVWNGAGLDAKVLLQREIDQLPEAPYMLRATELEMAPGASIDPHSHLGPGVQVVLAGAFTVVDALTSTSSIYESTPATPFSVYYTGTSTKYSTENRGSVDNRLFMAEILARSRGFEGNQKFDTEGGPHNRGGIRSGPYVQVPLDSLPQPPLMVRVTQIELGPKAKSPEYTRPGPGLFFIASGQATFRREASLFITTHGAGGYFFDDGTEPTMLENKPVTPGRVVAVEFLPAWLGSQPSTIPSGR
jgi:quercetin dioxygenase-like cupin family protein